jgi:hypothetical protein
MPMKPGDIEDMIKAGIPGAKVTIRDLASAARAGCSSTRWSMTR